MHIRALTLRPFDLTPVAGEDLVFESRGRQGEQGLQADDKDFEYGIASIDFQLADEVNMGDYQIRASIGKTTAQKDGRRQEVRCCRSSRAR